MHDGSHKEILDRGKSESDVSAHFSKALTLLQDIVDYGTHLILRALGSSDRRIEDLIVIAVLLKQVVLLADAIQILVSKAAVQAAFLDARVALEASVSIEWILKSDSETKAKHFYVANLRRQRLWALRLINGTPERIAFSHVIDFMRIEDPKLSSIQQVAQQEVDHIDALLTKPGWKRINERFEKEKGKKRYEVFWYKPLGISSIGQMAKDVGRRVEWDTFYAHSSELIHSSSYREHIEIASCKQVTLHSIRGLEHLPELVSFVVPTILKTYRNILTHYRPGEVGNFDRKYKKSWRKVFMETVNTKVEYHVELTHI